MTTITAASFNHDVSAAKRAATNGPVVITDRGEPAFVLLSIDTYRRLSDRRDVVDRLQMDAEIDFEPATMTSFPQVADL